MLCIVLRLRRGAIGLGGHGLDAVPILGNAEEPLRQVLRRLPEVQARICADPEPLSEDHPHFSQWMACALITREANMLLMQYDWGDLAHIICTHAMEAWRDDVREVKASNAMIPRYDRGNGASHRSR
jgi:hypothetical protein